MEEFTSYLEDKLANKASTRVASKPPTGTLYVRILSAAKSLLNLTCLLNTEVKPFCLTKPTPRVISYEVEEVRLAP